MQDTIQIRERRARLLLDTRKLNDKAGEEKRDLTVEEQGSWNGMMAELGQLDRDLELAGIDLSEPYQMIGREDTVGHQVKGQIHKARAGAADYVDVRTGTAIPVFRGGSNPDGLVAQFGDEKFSVGRYVCAQVTGKRDQAVRA